MASLSMWPVLRCEDWSCRTEFATDVRPGWGTEEVKVPWFAKNFREQF